MGNCVSRSSSFLWIAVVVCLRTQSLTAGSSSCPEILEASDDESAGSCGRISEALLVRPSKHRAMKSRTLHTNLIGRASVLCCFFFCRSCFLCSHAFLLMTGASEGAKNKAQNIATAITSRKVRVVAAMYGLYSGRSICAPAGRKRVWNQRKKVVGCC